MCSYQVCGKPGNMDGEKSRSGDNLGLYKFLAITVNPLIMVELVQ